MNIVPIARYRGSVETVCALERLLADARSGKVIGIAYVAMNPQREYIVDIAGETRRCLTWTLGMVRRLDHELNALLDSLQNRP